MIFSKEFIETVFDNQLAVSVQDKALGAGQIGLVTRSDPALFPATALAPGCLSSRSGKKEILSRLAFWCPVR